MRASTGNATSIGYPLLLVNIKLPKVSTMNFAPYFKSSLSLVRIDITTYKEPKYIIALPPIEDANIYDTHEVFVDSLAPFMSFKSSNSSILIDLSNISEKDLQDYKVKISIVDNGTARSEQYT